MIGIPALLASIGLGVGAVLLGGGPSKTPYLDDKTYGVLGVLTNGVHAVVDVVAFIGAMAGLVLAILAVLGVLVVLFAVLLYLIGRGLRIAAVWARIAGATHEAALSRARSSSFICVIYSTSPQPNEDLPARLRVRAAAARPVRHAGPWPDL